MVKPGIFAAVLFGFLTSFDEATVGVLVAASGTPTLPVKIFSDLQVQYTPVAAAVSGLLILVVLVVILPLERWVGLMAPRDREPRRSRRGEG
jgi:putative spermidine/putrescine transport system permease protein